MSDAEMTELLLYLMIGAMTIVFGLTFGLDDELFVGRKGRVWAITLLIVAFLVLSYTFSIPQHIVDLISTTKQQFAV